MAEREDAELRMAEKEILAAFNELRAIRRQPPLSEMPEPPYCAFCGRSKKETGALVEGLTAYICFDCASEARRLLLQE